MSEEEFNLDSFVSEGPIEVTETKAVEEPKVDLTASLLRELVDVVKAEAPVAVDGKDGLDGAKGLDGIQGPEGPQGPKGDKGDNGVSVVTTMVQGDDLFIELSDGKVINAGNVRGPEGLQGPQGVGGAGGGYRGGGFNPAKFTGMANNLIFVTKASQLAGTLDSTKQYVIDGIIDMTGVVINVPSTGLYLSGHNFNISQLVSSEDNATLFYSATGGDLLMLDLGIQMSGAGSQVYDLTANIGFEAFEVARINYNNCSSLGIITNYRQGLETGTGRFGGKPELTLAGFWAGGFKVTTSITRIIQEGSYSLFKAGPGFIMQSRFFSDMNLDLPVGVSYFDFAPANFPNDNTLQLENGIVTRAGALDPDDALLTPNIGHFELSSKWKNNVGLINTRVGGALAAADTVAIPITTSGVSVEPTGTLWVPYFIEHFSEPTNGRLQHLGTTPTQFRLFIDLIVESQANNEIKLELWRYTDSTAQDTLEYSLSRTVNALQGGRDVAIFGLTTFFTLAKNDVFYIKMANMTSTQNITIEVDSTLILEAR